METPPGKPSEQTEHEIAWDELVHAWNSIRTSGLDAFVEIRDKWVNKGLFTVEKINEILELKRRVLIKLMTIYIVSGKDDFERKRDMWIRAGIITRADADQKIEEYRARKSRNNR